MLLLAVPYDVIFSHSWGLRTASIAVGSKASDAEVRLAPAVVAHAEPKAPPCFCCLLRLLFSGVRMQMKCTRAPDATSFAHTAM